MNYRALLSMFFVPALATSCSDNVTIDVVGGKRVPALAVEDVSINGGSNVTNQGTIDVKIPADRSQFPYEFKICRDERCSAGCSSETAMKLTGLSIDVDSEGEYWVCLANESAGGEKIWLPAGESISVDWTPPPTPTVILDASVQDAVVFEASAPSNEASTLYSGRICLDKLCTYGCADALKTSDTRFKVSTAEQGKFYHACIQAKDKAGNASQWAASEPFIVRSSAPILVVSDNEAPVTNASQNLICSDQMYRNFNGELKSGTRACGGTAAPTCSLEGETGCLVDAATQVVVAKMNLISANIKTGVTLGGVIGSYPSLSSPLTGATVTPDLSSMGPATPTGSYEFFDSAGNRYTGIILDGGTITPTATSQTLSAVGTLYRAATIAGDVDLLSVNIANGINLFGITGSALSESHSSCSSDGDTGCVATASYTAAATSGLAAKVLSGQTVAGVGGNVTLPAVGNVLSGVGFGVAGTGSTGTLTLPSAANVRTGNGAYGVSGSGTTPSLADCSADGDTGCVAVGPTIAAAVVTGLAPKVISGNTVAGIAGSATAESHSSCSADGDTGCVATASYTAAATSGLASKIVSGNTVAGIAGSATAESHSSCSADGDTGCVATASYTAAATSGLAAKVLSGQTVAGVGGNVTLPAVGNVLSGISFGAGSGSTGTLTLPSGANVRTGNGAYGVSGSGTTPSLADCATDGATGCVATATYTVALTTGLAPKVISGNTVAGIAGSATAESHSNCSSDGDTGCVATASYTAAATSGLAAKVLSGQTVAGVGGNVTLPAVGNVLTGISFGVAGSGSTGTLTLPSAANVRTGNGAYGVSGSGTTPTLVDCSTNNASGCVTTATYKSADFTNLTAANIKSGVNVAGVTGDYPSATNRLASNTVTTDLTLFATQLTTDGAFEFFDSAGTRYTGSGDSDIVATNVKSAVEFENLSVTGSYTGSGGAAPSAWDVRAGVTVNGVAGKLRANCRNLINSNDFNYDGAPASIPPTDITTGTALDWWDTLDNYNNNIDALPTQVPTLWTTNNICNTTTEVWLDLTADGSCSADSDACMFKDQITGLTWAEQPTSAGSVLSYTWPQAIDYCDSLSFGGHTDWRLPTQFEMMTAYTHGIRDIAYKGGTSATASNNQWFILNADDSRFWSATSVNAASGTNNAWSVNLNNGAITSLIKGGLTWVLCVRP